MNRSELVKTLELVYPALAATNMVPIFQCFTFKDGFVSAYNDSIAIMGPTEYEGVCGIHGKTLLGLLSNSSEESVDFTLGRDSVVLDMGKARSKLPFDPEENFIFQEPKFDKKANSLVLTQSVFDAIEICSTTVSNDQTQASLLGITCQGNKLYSCDGDAVTRITLDVEVKSGHRLMMPTAFCNAMMKIWSTMTMTSGVLKFNTEWVCAELGDWAVFGRLLDIKNPIDFDDAVNKTMKQKITPQALPEGFEGALQRARVIADSSSAKTTITITKGKMSLFTETHMGEIKDDLAFKGHPDAVVNVNAGHLERAIEYCDKVAFHENGTLFEKDDNIMMFVSNM